MLCNLVSQNIPQRTLKTVESESESHSVMSDSLWPRGLYSPWNSLGQNTRVGSLSLLQGSSQPRDRTQVSHIAGRYFTSWATREAHQDSRVQFIMPVGPRGLNLQQGPWCFWEAQFYTPHHVTGYMLTTSLLDMIEFYNK